MERYRTVSKNDFDNKINYDLVEDLYGIEFRNLLNDLEITTIIDVNQKIEVNHQYTSAMSIWFYGHGDFDFKSQKYGNIYIQSGCLAKVKSLDTIPFGTEYYEAHTGKHMVSEDEYREYVDAFEISGSKIGDGMVVNKGDMRKLLKKFKKISLEDELQKYTNENQLLPLTGAKIFTIIAGDNKKYYYKGLHKDLFT